MQMKAQKHGECVLVDEAACGAAMQVSHTAHTHGSREKRSLGTHPFPSALLRSREPGARAMPPLTGVGERCAPRATGVLH